MTRHKSPGNVQPGCQRMTCSRAARPRTRLQSRQSVEAHNAGARSRNGARAGSSCGSRHPTMEPRTLLSISSRAGPGSTRILEAFTGTRAPPRCVTVGRCKGIISLSQGPSSRDQDQDKALYAAQGSWVRTLGASGIVSRGPPSTPLGSW